MFLSKRIPSSAGVTSSRFAQALIVNAAATTNGVMMARVLRCFISAFIDEGADDGLAFRAGACHVQVPRGGTGSLPSVPALGNPRIPGLVDGLRNCCGTAAPCTVSCASSAGSDPAAGAAGAADGRRAALRHHGHLLPTERS